MRTFDLDVINRKKLHNRFALDYKVIDLISIRSQQEIEDKRSQLNEFLFSNTKFVKNIKPIIYKNLTDKRYKNAIKITKLEHTMEYGINSIAYLFQPKIRLEKLIIYCSGHNEKFESSKKKIEFFLDKGYDVLSINMPLMGENSRPTIYVKNIGPLVLAHHDRFKFLEGKVEGHPLKFFIEPVLVFVDYLYNNISYKDKTMIGVSGGGWTTTLYAALDTRINNSFSILGPIPLPLKDPSKYDCYEISNPDLFSIVNYLDLYIMGASGIGRARVDIINKYEKCCNIEDHLSYYEPVFKAIKSIGEGSYDIKLDEINVQHTLSKESLRFIHSKIIELESFNRVSKSS